VNKLREQIDKGVAAEKLLENPILRQVLSSIEKEIEDGWKGSKSNDQKQRENAYYMHRAVQALRDRLGGVITTGNYAQNQLEKENERT